MLNKVESSWCPAFSEVTRELTGLLRLFKEIAMEETVQLGFLRPLHWAIAGGAISALTLFLLWIGNTRLGMSTGFENVCSTVSRLPHFRRASVSSSTGKGLSLFAGLVVAGALAAFIKGGWSPTWELGRFDELVSTAVGAKVGVMALGGLFIGFGTRLAGGCTSGHAMFGVPNMEWASLRATLAFVAMGIVTANLVYRLVFV